MNLISEEYNERVNEMISKAKELKYLRHSSIPKYIRPDNEALTMLFIGKKLEYKFHYLIETNGVSCSLLFHLKDNKIKRPRNI